MTTHPLPTDPTAGAAALAADPAAAPVLVVTGEIDLGSAPAFGSTLRTRLDATAPGGRLDVDLSRVLFFSAAGLRVLLLAVEDAGRAGKQLRVTTLSPAVAHVVDLTGTRADLRLPQQRGR
jgi:anti-anti-sigma factor